jgi:uncharacterized membrane protein (UPF0127 family)
MRATATATVAVMTILVALSGCKHADDGDRRTAPPADDTDTGDTDTAPAAGTDTARPPASVVIRPASGEPATVYVEVVRKRRDIRHGLMYRQHMPPDQGMLFLMGENVVHTFWMKNTLIPLDMIFIKSDKTIAGIVENTEPLTTERRSVDEPSLYVLEVNAGWTKKHGVSAGDPVEFVDVGE